MTVNRANEIFLLGGLERLSQVVGTWAEGTLSHVLGEQAGIQETLWFLRGRRHRVDSQGLLSFSNFQWILDILSAPGFCENVQSSFNHVSSPLFKVVGGFWFMQPKANMHTSSCWVEVHVFVVPECQEVTGLLKNKRVELSTKWSRSFLPAL